MARIDLERSDPGSFKLKILDNRVQKDRSGALWPWETCTTIQEFSIMSEPIDPLSREMATSATPRSFTFRKFRGENLKAQFLSHFVTDFVHFTQFYSSRPKLQPYQKWDKNIKDNSNKKILLKSSRVTRVSYSPKSAFSWCLVWHRPCIGGYKAHWLFGAKILADPALESWRVFSKNWKAHPEKGVIPYRYDDDTPRRFHPHKYMVERVIILTSFQYRPFSDNSRWLRHPKMQSPLTSKLMIGNWWITKNEMWIFIFSESLGG